MFYKYAMDMNYGTMEFKEMCCDSQREYSLLKNTPPRTLATTFSLISEYFQ